MIVLSTIISVIFLFLALLHIYWASGGKIGINKALPTIDGKFVIVPGKILTLSVALSLFGIGVISYLLGHIQLSSYAYGEYVVYAGWAVTSLFLVRAIGDFRLVGIFKKYKDTEFAQYDTKYYVPFCLSVFIIFVLLISAQA